MRRPPAGTLTVMGEKRDGPGPHLAETPRTPARGPGPARPASTSRVRRTWVSPQGAQAEQDEPVHMARCGPWRHSRVFTASSRSQPAEGRELLAQGTAAGPSAGPASRGALLSASLGAIWTHSPSPTCRGRRHLKLTKGLKTVAPLRISWSAFYTSARMRLFPHFDSFSVLILL